MLAGSEQSKQKDQFFVRRGVATSSRNLGVENRFAHVYVFSKQRVRNITNNSTGSTGLLFHREVATSSRNLGVEKCSLCHVSFKTNKMFTGAHAIASQGFVFPLP